MPQISIIVPVYNTENYLRTCLNSILAQTLTDWEAILVDDGSKDQSGAICNEYAERDSRFVVVHKKNEGVSAARNDGLNAAKGCWVSFVDSDDFLEENYFENLYHPIRNDSQVDFVHGCGTYYQNGSKTVIEQFEDKVGTDLAYLMNNFKGYVCGKLFKRSLLDSIELGGPIRFDGKIRYSEDMVFTLEYVLRVKKYAFSSEVGYYYNRENEGSATHTIKWTYEDALYAFLIKYKLEMEFVKNTGIALNDIEKRVILLAIALHLILTLLGKKKNPLNDKVAILKKDIGIDKLFVLKYYQKGLIGRAVDRLFMSGLLRSAFFFQPLAIFENRCICYIEGLLRKH